MFGINYIGLTGVLRAYPGRWGEAHGDAWLA